MSYGGEIKTLPASCPTLFTLIYFTPEKKAEMHDASDGKENGLSIDNVQGFVCTTKKSKFNSEF